MEFRHLRTFVAVAEQGSVSKAAVLLRITQPALSRRIRDLEDDLGVRLFQRTGGRLILTGEGEQLLDGCRDLLSHATSLRERAQSICAGNAGVLRVAAGSKVIERFFPTFLRHYATRHPGIQMKVIEAKPGERLALLERGEVHFAIGIMRNDDDRLACRTLQTFDVLAVFTPSLRIEAAEIIDVGRLADLPLLLLKSGTATRKMFDAACRLTRLQPNIFIEGNDTAALLALAAAGHGVAVVASSEQIDPRKLRAARLACRREPLQMVMGVVWDKRRPLPRYAEGFPEAFATHMQEVFSLSRPSQLGQGRPAQPRRISVATGGR